MSWWPSLREGIITAWHAVLDYDRKIPLWKREQAQARRDSAKRVRLAKDEVIFKLREQRRERRENERALASQPPPLPTSHLVSEPRQSEKRERVTLSKGQAAEEIGRQLIEMTTRWMADGILDARELDELRRWLSQVPDDSIPAIRFLKEEIRQVVADGRVDEWEMDRIHLAILRILPKDERATGTAARDIVRKKRLAAEAEARKKRKTRWDDEDDEPDWPAIREANRKRWSREPATDAQEDYIRSLGGKVPRNLSKYDASHLIDELLSE